ncbi:alpha/beta fold hydrolase [Sciscionella marina]|uniref:alpha/beta fold hydrolase n=1 Tax=Sciscionella marina TaxID=508770 RepID=UPI00038137EB|nr:alpha/beta fold hydrolase [Sciscionella marina]
MNAPFVLFLHGFASTGARDWPSVDWADPLARSGRKALVADLPGHGSAPPIGSDEDGTLDRVLARLGSAARAAPTAQIDVVGYSLGARLAWDFVAASPVPVRRLVLGGLSGQDPFAAVDVAALRSGAAADPLTAAIAELIAADGRPAESLIRLVAGLARSPFDPAANPPPVPTLVLAGNRDTMAADPSLLAGHLGDGVSGLVPGDHREALHSTEFRDRVLDFLVSG